MELGGGWEHLGLDLVPEVDGDRHQLLGGGDDVRGEHVRREASGDELTEDVVDGRHGREGHVEDAEVPLQTVGNIVLPAPRRVHRREVDAIDNHLHVSDGFLQGVHAALFQELADNLVGHLVTPVVHHGHGNVVDEDDHLLSGRWPEGSPRSLLNRRLDGNLERPRLREGRERDVLRGGGVAVEPGHELLDRGGLRRAWSTDEQRLLVDAGDNLEERLEADRVEGGDDEPGKLGLLLRHRVLPRRDLGVPVPPLGIFLGDEVLEEGFLGVLKVGSLGLGQPNHRLVQRGPVLHVQKAAQRPRAAVEEHALVVARREVLAGLLAGLQDALEEGDEGAHLAEITRHVRPR